MSNKSNRADKVVRTIVVYASGKVSHRDATNGRSPWNRGTGWGRAGAADGEDASPSTAAPAPKVKDPRKVAAGKARAEQARKQREAAAQVAAAKPTVKKPAGKTAPAKVKRGGARPGAGAKPKNADGAAMVVMAVRVTPSQKAKFDQLGADWLRARIDAATVRA